AEAAGGVVLVAATVAALVWANAPWGGTYEDFWRTSASLSSGPLSLDLDLRHWVNDGLMTIFFLVVGIEIKRELVRGELRDPRRAALPAIAALGGMVVPALLYVSVSGGGARGEGWGIPMATDIAMAVGVLALLGRRVHPSLKLFLLALAIVDDIGAVVVIAVVYSSGVDMAMLGIVALTVVGIVATRRLRVHWLSAYVALGAVMWLAFREAGVHATLAGVVCGLLAPVTPHVAGERVERLEHSLHRLSSFVIVPLFALANAGLDLGGGVVRDALGSRVTLAVVFGLVAGKPIGITLASWIGVRLGLGALPPGVTWRELFGVASIAGIGFTVSLLITELAFDAHALAEEATLGVLAASLLSAGLGSLLVVTAARRSPEPELARRATQAG
ncbi:MAG TPA: Na+/H+ antiporter NhaA, partial [Acidimicrobiales bacterium]